MSARILLVTGSRALDGAPQPEHDQTRAVLRAVRETFAPTVIVSGGAIGPDSWAVESAIDAGLDARVYDLDGCVRNAAGKTLRMWTKAPRPTPLDRNAAMVRDVAREARRGATVRVIGLEAGWSATKGTAHTVRLALSAGLAVTHTMITGTRIQEGSDEG